MRLRCLFVLSIWPVYLSNLGAFAGLPLFVGYMDRFLIAPLAKMPLPSTVDCEAFAQPKSPPRCVKIQSRAEEAEGTRKRPRDDRRTP